jgi:hypothetical protein
VRIGSSRPYVQATIIQREQIQVTVIGSWSGTFVALSH